MQYYKTTFLLLLVILTLCSFLKKQGPITDIPHNDRGTIAIPYNDTDKIIFLVLKISRDTIQGKSVIEFVSKTKGAGKIKNHHKEAHSDYENYLAIEVYEKNKISKTIFVEHPLSKNVEYLDNNNTFTSKHIELDKAEFFIRFQMKEDTGKIRISEKLSNGTPKELTTLNF